MCVCVCACARACVGQGKSLGSQGTVQLSDGHRHARRAPQGRLQSQDLGKHLTGVEDLLQLHELVEADIAVQAERVRAVSASALRFCDPGKGDSGGRDWEREGCFKYSFQIFGNFPRDLSVIDFKFNYIMAQ